MWTADLNHAASLVVNHHSTAVLILSTTASGRRAIEKTTVLCRLDSAVADVEDKAELSLVVECCGSWRVGTVSTASIIATSVGTAFEGGPSCCTSDGSASYLLSSIGTAVATPVVGSASGAVHGAGVGMT